MFGLQTMVVDAGNTRWEIPEGLPVEVSIGKVVMEIKRQLSDRAKANLPLRVGTDLFFRIAYIDSKKGLPMITGFRARMAGACN